MIRTKHENENQYHYYVDMPHRYPYSRSLLNVIIIFISIQMRELRVEDTCRGTHGKTESVSGEIGEVRDDLQVRLWLLPPAVGSLQSCPIEKIELLEPLKLTSSTE